MNKKFDYEKWYNEYCNKKFIDVYKYFNEYDIKILNRLNIIIEKKLYTEREFELMDMDLYTYYEYNEKDEIIQSKLLEDKSVSLEEYKKVLDIFSKICIDYSL